MKKLVCLIAVLALTAPLFAAQSVLTLSASDAGSGQLKIGYASNDANVPVGISFKVALSGGAQVTASTDVVSSLSSVFNANVDYANSAGTGYTALGQGHPLANPDANGVVTFPASTFAVCMGSLLQSPAAPPASTANLITLQLHGTGSTQATISADTAGRNGCVGKGTAFSVVYPAAVTVNFAAPECVKSTATFYAAWKNTFSSPACWCYQRACRGDVNGAKTLAGVWVSSTDLNTFKLAYNKDEATLLTIANGWCADNNRAKTLAGVWVSSTDLNTFKLYYNQPEASVPVCDQANYNFWTN